MIIFQPPDDPENGARTEEVGKDANALSDQNQAKVAVLNSSPHCTNYTNCVLTILTTLPVCTNWLGKAAHIADFELSEHKQGG